MALVDPPVVAEPDGAGAVEPADAEPPVAAPTGAESARTRRPVLGIAAVGCAALMVLATVAGSLVAGTLLGAAALPLAILALAFSAAAVVLGLIAALRGPGRALGIAGVAAGVLLDPALLALLLRGTA